MASRSFDLSTSSGDSVLMLVFFDVSKSPQNVGIGCAELAECDSAEEGDLTAFRVAMVISNS